MNPSCWLSANRIINVLILSVLVTPVLVNEGGGGGTGICCFLYGTLDEICFSLEEGGGENASFGEVEATIHDLTFKGLPIVADPADVDPKDMSVTKGSYVSPTFGPSKRLLMRAKKDAASHRLSYAREFQGAFENGLLLAVDPGAGTLVDGQSAGYYEIAEVPGAGAEGVPIHMRMTATWDASAMGLRVSAEDQGGALGISVVFPNATEVQLSMIWNEDGRTLTGFPVSLGEGPESFFFTDVVPIPAGTRFLLSFGAEALGKKARFYFTNLLIRGSSMAAGAGEVAAAMHATLALAYIEAAWIQAQIGADPAIVKARLDPGLAWLDSARNELDAAMAAGDVHPTTQTKLAVKTLKKGMKTLIKSGKLANKLSAKEKPANFALAKRANKARWAALLIQAQLFGFKSKSIDKYFATMNVTSPDFGIF